MPTNKHRYMIVLNEYDEILLKEIMIKINTKQKSKAISECIKIVFNTLIAPLS